MSAFCVALMVLSGFIPIGTYAFPALCGIVIAVMVKEFGYKLAFAQYVVVSVLSFILVAYKETALMFIALFGFYPILKQLVEKITIKVVQILIKLAVFNICMVLVFYVGVYFLGVPAESYTIFNVYLPYVFLIAGNVCLFLYDRCITIINFRYANGLRDKIAKIFKI